MRPLRGQLAYREALTAPIFGVAATVAGIFALSFALIGPYGSHHVLSVLQRLLYCSFAHALHLVVAYAGFVGTLYLTRFRTELQTVAAFALEILVISAPCAAITYAVYSWYLYQHLSQPAGDIRVIQEMYAATVPSLIFANALVYSVVRLRLGAAALATDEMMRPAAAPTDEMPVAHGVAIVRPGADLPPAPAREMARPALAPDAFHRRLPAEAGRDVVYLKAAGHYVNVTTTAGSGFTRRGAVGSQ